MTMRYDDGASRSRQDFVDHVAMNICQAEITSAIPVGQSFVI